MGKVHKVQVQGEKSFEITLTSTTERKLSPIWPSSPQFPKINEFEKWVAEQNGTIVILIPKPISDGRHV